MRAFVTGGSGFVGAAVLDELVARGHQAVTLRSHRPIDVRDRAVTVAQADLFDSEALANAMHGCDACVHLVGIIGQNVPRGLTFEHMHVDATRAVLGAVKQAGVHRYLHMSALGARAEAPSAYHRTKAAAEELVRASSLDWTIFRPSLIHGPGGEFVKMLGGWAKKRKPPWLFMPYFGRGVLGLGGAGKLQPIFVGDVARVFVDALEKPETIGKSFDLAGPDVMTWPQMHAIAARAIVGKKRWIAPIPAWWGKVLASILPEKVLGTNRDQIEMSQEDNTADIGPMVREFGLVPGSFERLINEYASRIT